jgi:hypothetical protein
LIDYQAKEEPDFLGGGGFMSKFSINSTLSTFLCLAMMAVGSFGLLEQDGCPFPSPMCCLIILTA